MKLVCGLGNPGLRYKNTRHNIGFLTVDTLARRHKVRIGTRGHASLFARAKVSGQDVCFLKPQTFMNNSGEALRAVAEKFGIDCRDILIVCDDIELRLGIIRLRARGSAGSHKGLVSVIDTLGTKGFNRLRIGVGRERTAVLRDYVLSGFKRGEKETVQAVVQRAADAIEVWVEEGVEAAMNRFNTKNVE